MVKTCEEGDWFTPYEGEKPKPVDEYQDLFKDFKDPPPPPGSSKECYECEKAMRDQKIKCDNVRKRVAYALRQAGCPSIVKPIKTSTKKCSYSGYSGTTSAHDTATAFPELVESGNMQQWN